MRTEVKNKDRNAVIGGLIFALFIAVCLAFIWNREAEGDAYEPIDCPDGYVDCKGIPVTPTAEPEEPTVVVEPTPTATPESVWSCRHQHEQNGTVFIHFGWQHAHPNPAVGEFDSYSPERCGH